MAVQITRRIGTAVTASGALTAGQHTPLNAASGALTMTLPATANAGAHLSVERVDTTANAVTITGSIRGVGSSSMTLSSQTEWVEFIADASNSWWPTGGGKYLTQLGGYTSPKTHGSPILMTAPNSFTGKGTFGTAVGVIQATPFYLGSFAVLTKMSFHVENPAGSGAFMRLGMYGNLAGSFAPGTLLYDAGQVASSAGFTEITKVLTTPLPLQPGLYWAAAKLEGSASTITVNCVATSKMIVSFAGSTAQLGSLMGTNIPVGYASTAQADGALPTPYPVGTATTAVFSNSGHNVFMHALQLETS